MAGSELALRYGCNPNQAPARVFARSGTLPFEVLNGTPGYINLLDALNSWQLVRELREATGLPAAASFKHVSSSGAAVAVPLSGALRQAYFVQNLELTPLAPAYARARGADRMSSFGDWVAVSEVVDVPTALLLRREVSHGIIAPGYEDAALDILRQKFGGKYITLAMDAEYQPPPTETREVYGVSFEQRHGDARITAATLRDVVTRKETMPAAVIRDLLVALIALKYTQSNSVCYALGGQVIGMGAGQQSRIHSTRLAGSKADTWLLRQHPVVLALPFRDKISRPERDNAIDLCLLEGLSPLEEEAWLRAFRSAPVRLSADQKLEWLRQSRGIVLASDGYFPFRDSIDRARQSGVEYVAQPGGSVHDDEVIEACEDHGMTMAFTGLRLFHH